MFLMMMQYPADVRSIANCKRIVLGIVCSQSHVGSHLHTQGCWQKLQSSSLQDPRLKAGSTLVQSVYAHHKHTVCHRPQECGPI